MKSFFTLVVLGLVGVGFWKGGIETRLAETPAKEVAIDKSQIPSTPEIKRAQKQAKMLDTLYKTAIVIITENYVTGEESMAAGDAFQALFKVMKDKGFHEVRLLDATGGPYDSDNAPATTFEKHAIKAILAGENLYEEVVQEGEVSFLLSATPIPVVMEKCVMCHSNYEGVKGPIGALGLKIPVE